MWFEPAMVGPN